MKRRDVVVQVDAILVVQIHHVARAVVVERDVLLQVGRQAEVRHRELRGEKRRREIVVAVFDLHEQLRIRDHRLCEVVVNVRRAREKSAASRPRATRPVPARVAGGVVIDAVLAEFQLVVVVLIDERGDTRRRRPALRDRPARTLRSKS